MPFNLSPSRGFDTSARARFTNKACRINKSVFVSPDKCSGHSALLPFFYGLCAGGICDFCSACSFTGRLAVVGQVDTPSHAASNGISAVGVIDGARRRMDMAPSAPLYDGSGAYFDRPCGRSFFTQRPPHPDLVGGIQLAASPANTQGRRGISPAGPACCLVSHLAGGAFSTGHGGGGSRKRT